MIPGVLRRLAVLLCFLWRRVYPEPLYFILSGASCERVIAPEV